MSIVAKGSPISDTAEHLFVFFQNGGRCYVGFLNFWNFSGQYAQEAHRAKFRRNRSTRGRDMASFRFFQDGGRPASWICTAACVRTTHEGHLVVFISVHNLVGIDAVVLIMCMFL